MSDEKMSREESIRQRAYSHWLEEGRQEGRDTEHWHAAVEEIDRESDTSDREAELTDGSKDGRPVGSPSSLEATGA